MLGTLAVVAMLQGYNVQGNAIECVFPPTGTGSKTIRVSLEPSPSLKDRPGLFRVMMTFGGSVRLRASAQPIASTEERDMLIQARGAREMVVTLGLRDDGAAALNMHPGTARDTDKPGTRIGACSGATRYFDRWLSS